MDWTKIIENQDWSELCSNCKGIQSLHFQQFELSFPTNPRIRWCLDLLPTLGFGRASKLLKVAGRVFLENRCRTSFIAGLLLVVQGFLLVGSFQEMSTSGLTSLIMIQQHHLGTVISLVDGFPYTKPLGKYLYLPQLVCQIGAFLEWLHWHEFRTTSFCALVCLFLCSPDLPVQGTQQKGTDWKIERLTKFTRYDVLIQELFNKWLKSS